GKNSGTLIVIQDKNKGDSSYFYYGGYGRTPQYVYVEGSLVENYALEVDPDLQVMRIPFPAGRIDLDFSGISRQAETSVFQMSGMLQQILNQLSVFRLWMMGFVNITQPAGPAIRIPTIDLAAWISALYALIDAYSPIKASLLIPLLLFSAGFLGIYAVARKLGLKKPERLPPAGAGETVVVVKRERPSLAGALAKSAATSLIAAMIVYLVLPRIFPAYFSPPSNFQLMLAAMVLASTIVGLIAWLAAGRRETYRGEKA
ncbi:MAG: hypothetical protein QW692_03860, partial [Nitrososphaerota archaeon]